MFQSSFFVAVPNACLCLPYYPWCKFMREPHLSGVVRITHFVHDDVVMLSFSQNLNKNKDIYFRVCFQISVLLSISSSSYCEMAC